MGCTDSTVTSNRSLAPVVHVSLSSGVSTSSTNIACEYKLVVMRASTLMLAGVTLICIFDAAVPVALASRSLSVTGDYMI